ncbi:hypothetical protein E5F05_00555 (plasmid) [Deinococcus metallilatus]|uniref:Uncharacterized protein n=1 Tax=Deinococcus metallilatus TaxID=1211322 RepID=A0AAJ5FC42_9DEIO|nr:hypothetical protein [Deinococcus metallilatus]MBB5293392.1 hypothetical protein [Deinococcus metallilatus]QBY06488.1 hypothetical protein E5F05_00555 [Deinococcus metallilatus]RXJ17831.1 hypothetical protein ERJ73_00165 [Deinococcus metallilatus]TLK32103.1 hypothetical protein FCS05_01185 [Deinococcus metallilatus]
MNQSLSPLFFALTLLLTACPAKQAVTQESPSAAPAQKTGDGIKDTLLKAAQTKPSTSERTFCTVSIFTAAPTKISASSYEDDQTQAAIKAGYFAVTDLGNGQYKVTPTAKYQALLQHARIDTYGIPRFCFGKSRLTSLSNLRQAAPDKYLADGKLTLEPEVWATREVLAAFGPTRNDPSHVPLSLVFYKSGDTWEAEKR